MATKKVGSAGRFGCRYGKRVRRMVAKVESSSRAFHVCPQCKAPKLKRANAGLWSCTKCGVKIAGGAYAPSTRRR
ncbi:MAG: 50S ribosomal protein L37ae [Candidatus Undinarchaeales archaeon]|jgi:large subunit ribosomal protein L37Ae|nr:50S ribosomal protein L37ae [Candidatus Undinarchaeales archaeon]MDP7492412.1 50S ribosomal protein L37ae [Candidatus Undinarchaeales archaeon]